MGAPRGAREADRAEAHAWSIRMEGYGGSAQPSPTIRLCRFDLARGECNRCETRASLPLDRHPPAAGYADVESLD